MPERRSTRGCCATRTCRRPRSPSSTRATSGSCPRPAAWPAGCRTPPGEETFPRFSPDGVAARLQRQLRRQHRHLRRAVGGGLPDAGDPPPGSRPHARLVSRTASSLLFASGMDERQGPLQPALPGRRATAACPRSCPCPTASSARSPPTARRWPTCRSRATSAPGSATAAAWRPTSGCSTWRATRREEPHRQRRQRRAADVARRHALLPLRPRRQQALQHLGDRRRRRQRRARSPRFDDYDVRFPAIGPDDIVFENGGRLYLLDLATETVQRGRGRGGHRPGDAQAARGEGRRADRRRRHLAQRQAGRARGAGRASSRCRPSTASVAQPDPQLRRRRALPGLVAGRQVDRLLQRPLRRVRADGAARRRLRRGAQAHLAWARASATASSGRPTARRWPSSTRR